ERRAVVGAVQDELDAGDGNVVAGGGGDGDGAGDGGAGGGRRKRYGRRRGIGCRCAGRLVGRQADVAGGVLGGDEVIVGAGGDEIGVTRRGGRADPVGGRRCEAG